MKSGVTAATKSMPRQTRAPRILCAKWTVSNTDVINIRFAIGAKIEAGVAEAGDVRSPGLSTLTAAESLGSLESSSVINYCSARMLANEFPKGVGWTAWAFGQNHS